MTLTALDPGRFGVIAASSRWAAERFLASRGVEARLLLTGAELARLGTGLRARIQEAGIETLALHSTAWRRQPHPQLYEVALALAPVRRRLVVDEELDEVEVVSRGSLLRSLSIAPAEVLAGAGLASAEAVRHLSGVRAGGAQEAATGGMPGAKPSVLAIWRGSLESRVGGSVTHISGILGGFRRKGFHVSLVTAVQPAAQVARVVDETTVTAPLGPGARLTADLERITANRPLRLSALAAGRRRPPAFVYQRHDFCARSGIDAARCLGRPLVLEWNSSEVWARNNWRSSGPFAWAKTRLIDPLAVSIEREVAQRADLVAAVSERAAEMAVEAGAPAERVLVVPNGVDVSAVPPPRWPVPRRSSGEAVVGWIGSFGPWHGADVLIRSLLSLPLGIRLLLVGDGIGKPACEALAAALGVAERIEWTGRVPNEIALRRLSECDVLASPHVPLADTPFFGSPTKIFEYMALGRPIVASSLEQLSQVLEDARTARLVRPGSPEELAVAISSVLSLPDRGRQLGEQARAEAMERHGWETRAAAIVDRLAAAGHLLDDGRYESVTARAS
ncbi:MAG TPA: glycosyltransferase family 4 protein [Acidimicrobiales bacterium]|nr:glycosyltransferase family 4 protein [Acidimicrobiales bacterium]